MGTENDNNFETVVIEGEVWAVTSPADETSAEHESTEGAAEPGAEENALASDHGRSPESEPSNESGNELDGDAVTFDESESEPSDATTASEDPEEATVEVEFDPLRALTRLLVGGAIEGTSQITARLEHYQEELRREAAEAGTEDYEADSVDEDELVRLRYALVGLIFDAQETFRRNVTLWATLADRSARATNRVAQPVTNSFFFNPIRRRYLNLVKRGEDNLARWISDGRIEEQPSRDLARRAYTEIVDEFIDRLADNPELQAVITKQSIGVASDMRDEVRERTVTADNLVEGLVRRVLRRSPRAELPEPPSEVQRWAGLTLEEYRAQKYANEDQEQSS